MTHRDCQLTTKVAIMHSSEVGASVFRDSMDFSDSITTSSDSGSSSATPDVTDEEIGYIPACTHQTNTDLNKTAEAILIFDYDDTLFPTSFLAYHGYRLDGSNASPEIQVKLDEFSKVVQQTLQCAEMHGRVVIVTNAETGWIELTSKKYMPSLCSVLSGYPLVSARSKYEPLGVASPCQWKVHAFGELLRNECLRGNTAFNLVSFGDSSHERDAAHLVCEAFEQIHCKSVKFMERPDLDQLSRQHTLITSCLDQVMGHNGTLDLSIQFEASKKLDCFSTITSPSSGVPQSATFL